MRISPRIALSVTLAAALALSAPSALADLELPRPSPGAKVSQEVGLTQISVDYSCPGVKGRKIWGDLVPYDKLWRTGANAATKVTFSKDVTFVDKPVPAGSYALFTIPARNGEWTVVLNKNADQPGIGREYKADQDLLRVKVRAQPAPFRERLAFIFSNFDEDKTSLDIEWEKLRVTIPIKVGTAQQAVANINKELDNAWRPFANAARYMLEIRKDYDAGLKYVDQSLALKQDWFNLWIRASLLAAKGNYKDARAEAQKSYDLGEKAGAGFFLEGEVKKALAEWSKKT
ncbi:MAG TPA: DUF2911 domain-containing protein [Polyangia bacterium]|nr:DUF2911 domain-containing protein [Polyangia bacterium]